MQKGRMLLEGKTPYEVARFYSASTAAYAPVTSLVLFVSGAYLQAGNTSYLQACACLAVAELLKYVYIQLAYHKDFSLKPKQGFKLLSVVLHLLEDVRVVDVLRAVLVLIAATGAVFLTTVLFGAKALSHHRETFVFSCLFTVLTVFPVCLHKGIQCVVQFLNGTQPEDVFTSVLAKNIQWTATGAWLGAVVIPLDWNREWQAWPIPCSFGALIGFSVAQIISIFELLTKRNGKSNKTNSKFR